jgi:hypothetical protein
VTRLQAIAAARNYRQGWTYHALKHQRHAAENAVLPAACAIKKPDSRSGKTAAEQ